MFNILSIEMRFRGATAFLFAAVMAPLAVRAQSELSMYRLNATLPQANMLNPAFFPEHKVVIGLPVISSFYASVNNDGLAFRDIFVKTASDSLTLDTLGLPRKLKARQKLNVNNSIQLFYFGLRGKRSYFSLGIHQISETRFNYPGDVLGWAMVGPGNPRYAGRDLSVDHFKGRSLVYNQISVNYTRDITGRLRLGARFKYLMGIASGESTEATGSVRVSSDSITLRTGNVKANTAGVDFFNRKNLSTNDYVNYLLKSKNRGVALDLGAVYQLNNRITLSAAVNDIGYINWKDYTHSYTLNDVYYSFKGFNMLDYLNQQNGQQFLKKEADSLKNLYTFSEKKGDAFRTSLIGKFYAGVNYRILKINNISALFYVDLFKGKVDPAVSVAYNMQLGRTLNAVVSAAYRDGKFNNFGAGISIRLFHIQLYATSDRANSYLYPARAGSIDGHVGMNLVFGKPKKSEREKKEEKRDSIPQIKPDSVVNKEAVQKDSVAAAPVETIPKQDSVQLPIPIEQAPSVKDSVIVAPEKTEAIALPPHKDQTVKAGNHPDEFPPGHYVIVGAFRNKQNAAAHNALLRSAGYPSNYAFLSQKLLYYVYVFKSDSDLEAARVERNRVRSLLTYQFPDAWVLTVE
jgi:cell division septation protein DedD